MRKYLTTNDVARLCRRSRAQILNWLKAGKKIPGRVITPGKHNRFIDSPILRGWCEQSVLRLPLHGLGRGITEAIVRQVIARDYQADPEGFVARELNRQLHESEDPDELYKKWERGWVEERPEDLPRVDLAHLGCDVVVEMRRQILDSEDPDQLITRWARALVEGRPEDLPRVL
jgi:hypothetical protein